MILLLAFAVIMLALVAWLVADSERQAHARHEALLAEVKSFEGKLSDVLNAYHDAKLLPSLELLSSQRVQDRQEEDAVVQLYQSKLVEKKRKPLTESEIAKLGSLQ